MSLSIVDSHEFSNTGSKSSGVNKLFIIGIVYGVREEHHNVSCMLTRMKAFNAKLFYSVDLKIANILAGLQGHSCKHPCTWCETNQDDLANISGSLWTLGSLVGHFNVQHGASKVSKKTLYWPNYTSVTLIPCH
jgi:hypothetical protein